MTEYVAGIDLGSTGVKILLAGPAGDVHTVRQRPTPWRTGRGGRTTLTDADLLATVAGLLDEAAEALGPDARVAALAVSGMGETGFVTGSDGRPVAPAFAWFDRSGAEQAAAFPTALKAEFGGRTGVPWGVQVSAAKMLHLRDGGVTLAGRRWANLPEFVAAALGAEPVGERSLVSRTGLIDQDTGAPWPELLAHLGVDHGFLPPVVAAGTPLGEVTAPWAPPAFAGARLTVAGHDHLVAALAGGAGPDDRYYVSMGTAEVVLRIVESPLTFDARRRLTDMLINCVPNVVAGQHVLVAGVKTGLLMRRALGLFGISDAEGRDRLDAAVCRVLASLDVPDGAVEVRGARNDDGVLSLTVRADGVGPADVFRAVLEHGNAELERLIAAMEAEVAPAHSTLITGGWTGMRSVRAARARVFPSLEVSDRSQDTAYGASQLAARLLVSA